MGNDIRIPNRAWIMVADHSKVIFLENMGTPFEPLLEVRQVMEASRNPRTHEQGPDAPGRVYAGSHRSSVEQTDLHAAGGRQFLEHAVNVLEKAKTEHGFKSLILVAPPRALAELRDVIPDQLSASIVGELDKDLTCMTVTEITHYLAK